MQLGDEGIDEKRRGVSNDEEEEEEEEEVHTLAGEHTL